MIHVMGYIIISTSKVWWKRATLPTHTRRNTHVPNIVSTIGVTDRPKPRI